ncbi:MAG TPA: hypothetical protein VJ716_00055 [Gaiellaceae bacterium]|nr:hypothetical protein [Gaiellaceae bacterium]
MKLRELLHKLRLRSVQPDGERSADNVDGLGAAGSTTLVSGGGPSAPEGANMPPGYVPSQQDDRPRHH